MTKKTNRLDYSGASVVREACPLIINDQPVVNQNNQVVNAREAYLENLPPAPFMIMTDEEFNAEVERRIKEIKDGAVKLIRPEELDEAIRHRKRLWA